jgi:photoactive yellow protein
LPLSSLVAPRRRPDDRHCRALAMPTIFSQEYQQLNLTTDLTFDHPGLAGTLAALDAAGLDALDFGVIGFDREGRVQLYNAFESRAAGLRTERVLGQDLFTLVAPCMNNYLVAQKFVEAHENGSPLDDTISYVLTLRMRPTKVKLRLLSEPSAPFSYVLVHRL